VKFLIELCYALVLDLQDKFTNGLEFWDTIFQGRIESLGIILIAFGFNIIKRKLGQSFRILN